MREQALMIWEAGVDAVLAEPLVANAIEVDGDFMMIDTESFDRKDFDRVLVVGAGKAGSAMAAGLERRLGAWLPIAGIVNVPEGTERSDDTMEAYPTSEVSIHRIKTHAARPAGINEPTVAGVAGSQQMMSLVRAANQRDLVIALISGGGSALMPLPIDGVTIEHQLAVIRLLSGAGATIDELNTVRKHLSKIKGGGLLRACQAKTMLTLILSDVLGDPLDVIASGPTVMDSTTIADAKAVLHRFDPNRKLPQSIYEALEQENALEDLAPTDEPLKVDAYEIVIGNNAVAVDAAGVQAESMGFNHIMQSSRQSEGGAEAIGVRIADIMVEMLQRPAKERQHDCLIWGGEPTVELIDAQTRGKGGRNQQLALAAYRRLIELDLPESHWKRIAILSAGTDGEDGPTDAAGAVVDAGVHLRATQANLDPAAFLKRNDAYHFFEATGGLIITGPTGTNVCDIRVAIVN